MAIATPAKISFPLDIAQVDVLASQQTRDGKFTITVESRHETTKCGVCKEEINCNYGRGQAVHLRHLPILGQETIIIIRPKRAQCPTCLHNPTTTQTLDWYDQRSPHTKAYDRYLMKLLIGSTVADVSLKENRLFGNSWGDGKCRGDPCGRPRQGGYKTRPYQWLYPLKS